MSSPPRTLEYWLAASCDVYTPMEPHERAAHVNEFVDLVNAELDGSHTACRLLAHRARSPDVTEALYALAVLEVCVNRCGRRFHTEMAKFKFLNELIKLLSSKYSGSHTDDRVKRRLIELMYTWRTQLSAYPKIVEAYTALRRQGIITTDPTYIDGVVEHGPVVDEEAPPKRLASFEDEEKARLLASLLASNDPSDLQAANRLIKSLVRAEDQRTTAKCDRELEMESAERNASIIVEMMNVFDPASSTDGDVATIVQLHDQLLHQRQRMFKYASENGDADEELLASILTVNDHVNAVIDDYKRRVAPHVHKFNTTAPVPVVQNPQLAPVEPSPSVALDALSVNDATLSDLLGPVGQLMQNANAQDHTADLLARIQSMAVDAKREERTPGRVPKSNPLDELSTSLMSANLPDSYVSAPMNRERQARTLAELQTQKSPLTNRSPVEKQTLTASSTGDDILLLDAPIHEEACILLPTPPTQPSITVIVPTVDEMVLKELPPFTLCEGAVRCSIFYAESSIVNQHVLLVNITSSSKRPVTDIKLTLTAKDPDVTLTMGVLTRDNLPPFSPITAQLTASMPFVVDVEKENMRVKFTLSYVTGEDDDAMTSGTVMIPLLGAL